MMEALLQNYTMKMELGKLIKLLFSTFAFAGPHHDGGEHEHDQHNHASGMCISNLFNVTN